MLALATAALAAGVAGWGAPPARAHGEASPFIRTVVENIDVPGPGVQVTPEAGAAAALRVVNRGPGELELTAPRGEPFLRIGPRGVFANVSSLYWYQSGNPDGVGGLPRGIRPGAPPQWVPVSGEAEWTWFEHRLHPAPVNVPPDAAGSRRRQRLSDWSMPVRLGGQTGSIEGYVEFRPVFGSIVSAVAGDGQPAPGAFLFVVPGRASGLYLQNTGRRRVVVEGRAGEDFARVGSKGVEVNLRSPTHQDDLRLKGTIPSVAANPDAPPLWRKVADEPRYGWIDTRVRYPAEQPPDAVVEKGGPTVLRSWTIPVEAGPTRTAIGGTTSWVPSGRPGVPAGGSGNTEGPGTGALGLLAAIGVVGAGALLLALRARRRAAAARVHARG